MLAFQGLCGYHESCVCIRHREKARHLFVRLTAKVLPYLVQAFKKELRVLTSASVVMKWSALAMTSPIAHAPVVCHLYHVGKEHVVSTS